MPACGSWGRLEAPAALVGLEGQTLNGMAFTLYGGKATWDRAGRSATKKYYYAGNQRIAMRQGNALYWLLGDHLGSTAYTVNGTTESGEVRYLPWGQTRFTSGSTPTTYRYTGQREEADLGLYYYGARWYDPALGRLIQPDTIVPNPGDVQSFDRYAYVKNNPLKYTDPTGHNGIAIHDSNDGPAASWQKWMALYDTDLDQLQGEILVWLQDHQADYRQIALVHKTLQSYAEAMGGTAVLSTFESVYANAYMSGGLPALWDHPGAEQLANDILAPIAGASMIETALNFTAMGPGFAPCSFEADTLVATSRGQRAITQINVGDLVLAFNETAGTTGYYPVTALMSHVDRVLVTLVIHGERIVTTPEHPFYTTANGWTPAGALQVGDQIRQATGSVGTVQSITVAERSQVMYNLTVADAHTFFVGVGQWLVHNQCPMKIHMDSQGKHIIGHKNYQPGKSILTYPDPEKLLSQYGGTGHGVRGTQGQAGYKEVVDFKQVIGLHVDQVGNVTPTTMGVIHYSNRGAHIVPSRP